MISGVDFTNEHEEVVWYVFKRKLVRPEITYIKAFCILLKHVFINCLALIFVYYFSLFILTLFFFINIDNKLLFFCLLFIVIIIDIFFYSKRAAIGIIKLYQHYAPEHVRRKCLFKPTCSEYAILSIEKYGLIFALPKIYDRIFKRCRGYEYKIDYP